MIEITIVEWIAHIRRNKRILAILFVGSVVLSIVATALYKEKYEVRGSIFVSSASQSLSVLGQIGMMQGQSLSLGTIKNPHEVFYTLFKSNRNLDGIIRDCSLMNRFESRDTASVRLRLIAMFEVIPGKDGVVTFALRHPDRRLALLIVESAMKNLIKVNDEMGKNFALERRNYLAKKIADEQNAIKLAMDKSLSLSRGNGNWLGGVEVEKVVGQLTQVEMEIGKVQAEISQLGSVYNEERVEITSLRSRMASLQKQRGALLSGGDNTDLSKKEIGSIGLKSRAMEYELTFRFGLMEMLSKLYANAELDYEYGNGRLTILDYPSAPERPNTISRYAVGLVILIVLGVLILGVSWIRPLWIGFCRCFPRS